MITVGKIVKLSVTATLLLVGSLATGAQRQVGAEGSFGSLVLGPGELETQLSEKGVCAECRLAEARAVQPSRPGELPYRLVYQIGRRQEQLVIEVHWVSNPRRWNHLLTTPHLRLRDADILFEQLTVAENRFKEVEVSGISSPSQTLDINKVTILE